MFEEALNLLSEGDMKTLSTDRYGEINLKRTLRALTHLRSELEFANSLDNYMLPGAHIRSWMSNSFQPQLTTIIENGLTFATADNGSQTVNVEELADRAEALYDAWMINARVYFPRVEPDKSAIESRLEDRLAELQSKFTELDTVINTHRTAAAESAATELASHYETERKARAEAANSNRLVGFLGLGAFVVIAVGAFFIWPSKYDADRTDVEQIVHLVSGSLARLVLLSVAAYVASFGFRNFRVNKHLETLYRRREIALNTSSELREAMAEPEQRGIIVAELVHSIFASDDTGYLSDSSDKVVFEGPGGAIQAASALARAVPTGQGGN